MGTSRNPILNIVKWSDALLAGTIGSKCKQVQYLTDYLRDMGAKWVVVEFPYFDHDFLSEYAAYYSTSAHEYSNRCQRIHIFASAAPQDTSLATFFCETNNLNSAKKEYLGFIVVRPVRSLIGRTVLRWYEDNGPGKRITEPSRTYTAHLLGEAFSVKSLAWQQQDSCVSACATIALWSLLHASAFDDHHAVPTTATITKRANAVGAPTRVAFPSRGLSLYQVCEAIHASELTPMVWEGDLEGDPRCSFSETRFAMIAIPLLRAGFPVLVFGELDATQDTKPIATDKEKDPIGTDKPEKTKAISKPSLLDLHAVCLVGFREDHENKIQAQVSASSVGNTGPKTYCRDSMVRVFYLHDDNIGPSVRCEIVQGRGEVALLPKSSKQHDNTDAERPLVPTALIAALPEEIRIDPLHLHKLSHDYAKHFTGFAWKGMQKKNLPPADTIFSAAILRLSEYLQSLKQYETREKLVKRVDSLSKYLGIIHVFWADMTPIFDVLFDGTDGAEDAPPIAIVVHDSQAIEPVKAWRQVFGPFRSRPALID